MTPLLEACPDTERGGYQDLVRVLFSARRCLPVGFGHGLNAKDGWAAIRQCAMAQRGGVGWRLVIDQAYLVQHSLPRMLSVFLDVVSGREEKAAGHTAWLRGIGLQTYHLEDQFSREQHLNTEPASRSLDDQVMLEHSTEISRLDDAASPQANRREMVSDHQALSVLPYIYRWNRCGRKGQRCAVFARSRRGGIYGRGMNSIGVRFEDGFTMVTSGNAIRKAEA